MKQLFVLFFVYNSISAFAQTEKTYSQTSYSIKYPENWTLDTSKSLSDAIFFFSPPESSSDNFSENVNVITQDLKGKNIDLVAYKSITEQQMAAAENIKLLSSEIENTPSGDRYVVIYQLTMSGNKLHIKSICYIKSDTAYLATFASTVDTFDKYDQIGTAILNSFELR